MHKTQTPPGSAHRSGVLASIASCSLMALACGRGTGPDSPYPGAYRLDQTDEYHGVKVADPYRWLEDPDSPQTRGWIEAQNRITSGFLEKIPQRRPIHERLTALWNYERYGVPFKEGGRYFFSRNDGLQNQAVLYVMDSLDGEPRALLDPNALSEDGTVALTGVSATRDGRYVAYGLSEAGSDWNTWRIREVETGRDLPDIIRWVKFSEASWTPDGLGFFYSRYDEPDSGTEFKGVNHYQKIYYHRLGTAQGEDTLIYERRDQPEWYLVGRVTEDGKYLVIHASEGRTVHNGLFYKDLSMPKAPVVELLNRFDAQYLFVENEGPVFWVRTDSDAPRWRLVAIDIRRPDPDRWQVLLPEAPESLEGVRVVGDRLFASYLKDAYTAVRMFDFKGRHLGEVELPEAGSAGGFTGRRGDADTFYSFASYTTPDTIFRREVTTGQTRVFRAPKVQFDPDRFATSQVFYASRDGTKIPMLVVHRKGIELDGSNPTLLYGYGGFAIPITPAFSVDALAWMEMGGVYAVANLRGGGEYGEAWHQAGMKTRKQNVFDDFIAAAEWLVANRYTSARKLAIQGASNGGLLVGACMTQRPDLFGACLIEVGVLDMLRFHKFTVGWGWVGDYGSAESDDPAEFRALLAYSPYHNLKKGTCYPKTLITTADHDDRVFPAHSFKFAAALQWAQGCGNAALIRIETRAGHGAGKPTSKKIEEAADQLAFLMRALEM